VTLSSAVIVLLARLPVDRRPVPVDTARSAAR
jgi:hypothetical protein